MNDNKPLQIHFNDTSGRIKLENEMSFIEISRGIGNIVGIKNKKSPKVNFCQSEKGQLNLEQKRQSIDLWGTVEIKSDGVWYKSIDDIRPKIVVEDKGKVVVKYKCDDFSVQIERRLYPEGFSERYRIINDGEEVHDISKLCIKLIFNTDYSRLTTGSSIEEGRESVEKVVPHFNVAGDASWLYVSRVCGLPPSLGISFEESYMDGFSRVGGSNSEYGSPVLWIVNNGNDYPGIRTDLPKKPNVALKPGGQFVVRLKYFWCEDWEDFFNKIKLIARKPSIESDRWTIPKGEIAGVQIDMPDGIKINSARLDGRKVRLIKRGLHTYHFSQRIRKAGQHKLVIYYGKEEVTSAVLNVIENPKILLNARAEHIDKRQRFLGEDLSDFKRTYAYMAWDAEDRTQITFLDYWPDPSRMSGADEGLAKVIFLAMKNVYNPDPEQISHLEECIHYFIRKHLQEPDWACHRSANPKGNEKGDMEGDVVKHYSTERTHTYAWIMNVYYWFSKIQAKYKSKSDDILMWAYHTAMEMYNHHGRPHPQDANTQCVVGYESVCDLIIDLRKKGKCQQADRLKNKVLCTLKYFMNKADIKEYMAEGPVEETSVCWGNYMGFKYGISGKYTDLHWRVGETYREHSYNFRQNMAGVRWWDGHWYGTQSKHYITQPHYPSPLYGLVYIAAYEATGKIIYLIKAYNAQSQSLFLFEKSGEAHVAFYPENTNFTLEKLDTDADFNLVFYLMGFGTKCYIVKDKEGIKGINADVNANDGRMSIKSWAAYPKEYHIDSHEIKVKVEDGLIEIEELILNQNDSVKLKLVGNDSGIISISGLASDEKYIVTTVSTLMARRKKNDYSSDDKGMIKIVVPCNTQNIILRIK